MCLRLNKENNIASSLTFAPIALSHKEQLESLRQASGNTLYVYTFASLFAWQEDEQYEVSFGDGAFLVKNGAEGDNAYLFPCGSDSGKQQLIDALLQKEKPVFYCVTDADKQFLETVYPKRFAFEDCRDEYSYLYDKEAQIALPGKDYKKLRHQIHIGEASAKKWETELLTEANLERAMAVNREWVESKSDTGFADADAAQTALAHFTELGMWGMLFRADGKDTAFIAGTFVTPEIFDLSFCKVLGNRRDYFVRWAVYRALPPEVRTIDSEEDMGIEGLRIHKLSRRPKELTRIWKGRYIHE